MHKLKKQPCKYFSWLTPNTSVEPGSFFAATAQSTAVLSWAYRQKTLDRSAGKSVSYSVYIVAWAAARAPHPATWPTMRRSGLAHGWFDRRFGVRRLTRTLDWFVRVLTLCSNADWGVYLSSPLVCLTFVISSNVTLIFTWEIQRRFNFR